MKCPQCGAENRSDAHFCRKCGQNIASQSAGPVAAPTTDGGLICPSCGTSVRPGARFCLNCGLELPVTDQPETSSDPRRTVQIDSTPTSHAATKVIANDQPPRAQPTVKFAPASESPDLTPPMPSQPEYDASPYATPPAEPPPIVQEEMPRKRSWRWLWISMIVIAILACLTMVVIAALLIVWQMLQGEAFILGQGFVAGLLC